MVSNHVGSRGQFRGRKFFHRLEAGRRGNGFWMIQVPYIYRACYFYYYHVGSTSDHQALDPRDWGPLL